jgi:hypothetical protein
MHPGRADCIDNGRGFGKRASKWLDSENMFAGLCGRDAQTRHTVCAGKNRNSIDRLVFE